MRLCQVLKHTDSEWCRGDMAICFGDIAMFVKKKK